jgi:hypothetical protein
MKRGIENRLIVIGFCVLILLVIGGFLIFKPKLTGLAVLSQYPNQTSCENAGYTWENITEESCNAVGNCTECQEGCVDEYTEVLCAEGCQADCTNITNCTECQEGCVDEYTEVLCGEGCQENCTECTEIITGGQCVGDVCDSGHLNLCSDETSCTAADGHWYNNACNSEEQQCVPDWTCTDWSSCSDGSQTRTCTDSNSCGTNDDKPSESKSCAVCGDNECNGDESCNTCSDDCGECGETTTTSTTNSITSSVTDENTFQENICSPEWQCSDWSECSDNVQTRTCEDMNVCDTEENMPEISQTCGEVIEESCFDSIQNQDEEGVDCGGICEQKCSKNIFTIIGNTIRNPVNSGKEFFKENEILGFFILGILILAVAGATTFRFWKDKLTKLKFWETKNIQE